jgi:hypothetical protein
MDINFSRVWDIRIYYNNIIYVYNINERKYRRRKLAMKKEKYNYFDEFIRGTECVVESAKILDDTLKKYSIQNLEKNIAEIHKLENEVDTILHKMEEELIKDFLPPIDREDISTIARRIDDIEDYIDETIINFNILNVLEVKEETYEFTKLLIEVTESVKNMMTDFKNLKKKNSIKEKIIKINEIEEKADRLYEKSMKKTYTETVNAVEIIKWTRIYECFENTIDTCEHIADCVEDVIMKN